MSIADINRKIKRLTLKCLYFLGHRDTLLSLIILFTGVSSFLVGKQSQIQNQNQPRIVFNYGVGSVLKKENDTRLEGGTLDNTEESAYISNTTGSIFASRNGKKYYYSGCKSGSRIKQANRVYYDTKEQAEATGKTLASGCK